MCVCVCACNGGTVGAGKTIGKVITTSTSSSYDALAPPPTPGVQSSSGAAATGKRLALGALGNMMARLSLSTTKDKDAGVRPLLVPDADRSWVSPVCADVITLLCYGIDENQDKEVGIGE